MDEDFFGSIAEETRRLPKESLLFYTRRTREAARKHGASAASAVTNFGFLFWTKEIVHNYPRSTVQIMAQAAVSTHKPPTLTDALRAPSRNFRSQRRQWYV